MAYKSKFFQERYGDGTSHDKTAKAGSGNYKSEFFKTGQHKLAKREGTEKVSTPTAETTQEKGGLSYDEFSGVMRGLRNHKNSGNDDAAYSLFNEYSDRMSEGQKADAHRVFESQYKTPTTGPVEKNSNKALPTNAGNGYVSVADFKRMDNAQSLDGAQDSNRYATTSKEGISAILAAVEKNGTAEDKKTATSLHHYYVIGGPNDLAAMGLDSEAEAERLRKKYNVEMPVDNRVVPPKPNKVQTIKTGSYYNDQLDASYKALEPVATNLQNLGGRLETTVAEMLGLQKQYEANPTPENYALYAQKYDECISLQGEYDKVYSSYESLYGDYESDLNAFNNYFTADNVDALIDEAVASRNAYDYRNDEGWKQASVGAWENRYDSTAFDYQEVADGYTANYQALVDNEYTLRQDRKTVDYINYMNLANEADFEKYASQDTQLADLAEKMSADPDVAKSKYDEANMSEEEIAVYNYLYNKQGEDAADEYYDFLKGYALRGRRGHEKAEKIQERGWLGETVGSLGTNAWAGVQDFFTNAGAFITGEEATPTASQVAASEITEEAGDFGRWVYGGTRSLGNMLPSIAASYLTGGAASALGASAKIASTAGAITGAATMGVSSAGGAMSQKLAEGWRKEDARTYGALVGLAEGSMQYILGGIGALGGISDDAVMAAVSRIDKTFLRLSATGVIKVAAEELEELIQLGLEPRLATMIGEVAYKAPTRQDVIDTIVMTAISTLPFAAIDTAGIEINYKKYGDLILEQHTVAELFETAKRMDPDSASFKLASRLMPETAKASDIGRLYAQMSAEGWQDPNFRGLLGYESSSVAGGQSTVTEVLGEQKTADSNAETTGANTRLTEADEDAYLKVGDREHIRNKKQEIKRSGDSAILTTTEKIQEFIKNSVLGKVRNTIKAYGKVGSRLQRDISQKSGKTVDVSGFYLELDSNRLEHLSDHVNVDNDPRNIPLTEEQVLQLPEYIDGYDDVLEVVTKKDGKTKITLGKRINGHCVIVSLVSKGRQSLQPVTAWQNATEHYLKVYGLNKKMQTGTSQNPNQKNGNESGYKSASTTSIPDSEQNINRNFGETRNADVQAVASTLGANGSKMLMKAYETIKGSVDAKTAAGYFREVYNAALKNENLDAVKKLAEGKIPSAMIELAEQAGKDDALRALTAKHWGEEAGLKQDKNFRKSRINSKQARILDAVGKALGVKIVIDPSIKVKGKSAAGLYVDADGTIHLAADTANPVEAVFNHEIIHRLREASPEAYMELAAFVMENADRSTLLGLRLLESKKDKELDADGAYEEVIANAFGRLMADKALLEQFAAQCPESAHKIRDTIRDIVVKIREFLHGAADMRQHNAELAAYKELGLDLEAMEKKLSQALGKAQRDAMRNAEKTAGMTRTVAKDGTVTLTDANGKVAAETKTTAGVGGGKAMIDAKYADEVETWFRSTTAEERRRASGKYFVAGTTSEVLKSLGARDQSIRFYGAKMQKILDKHPEMSRKLLKKIPEILEDPVIVMKSATRSDSIAVVNEQKAKNGEYIFVVLRLHPKKGIVIDNFLKISSAYGRSNENIRGLLFGTEEYGPAEVLYLAENKDRAKAYLNCIRVQFPSHQIPLGSIGTISYAEKSVNIQGKTYSELLLGKTSLQLTEAEATEQAEFMKEWKRRTKEMTPAEIANLTIDDANAVYDEVQQKLEKLRETHGTIRPGENTAREANVPKKTADGRKVSQTVRTILEAKATPDAAIPTIEEMVAEGELSYDSLSDKKALEKAEKKFEDGWERTVDSWLGQVRKGKISKELTAEGWVLYNNAVNKANKAVDPQTKKEAMSMAMDILQAMVGHQRNAAQALQATRILKKLNPETRLYGIQRSVASLQRDLNEKYGDEKAPKLKVSQELGEAFLGAETEEARAAIMKEIYRDIGRQLPSRFMDKWNAWRYLAMLGNTRTHVRNILGNALFAPVVAVKNLTATGIEAIVNRVSGGKTDRTKAFVGLGKADRGLLKAAWNDFAQVQETFSDSSKYADPARMGRKHIEEGRVIFRKGAATKAAEKISGKTFEHGILETLRRGNSNLLEKEDAWFSQPHYASALAQYCKANGITAEMLSGQKNTAESGGEIAAYQKQQHHGIILNTVRNHLAELQSMSPVKTLTGTEFQKTNEDTRSLRERVLEFFTTIGNKVTRAGFGDIALNNAGVRDSLGHGYGKLKAATFAALPNVLQDGQIIHHDPNYEQRGYESYLIAAPVNVGKETCYVGAMVIKDKKTQRYKVHEVLTVNENGTPSFKTESPKNGRNIRDGVPPNTIIRNGADSVNSDLTAKLDAARAYAIQEALKATYRDTNVLSEYLSKRASEKKWSGKVTNTVMDGILPFRKTPANILARGLEYSPLGLLWGVKKAVWDVRRGNKTAAEAIDSISAGLTGTMLLGLGIWAAAMGLIRGHGGEDDEKKEFEELMGHQAYSLEAGDTSVTLDWLAPEVLPLFIGVNLWELGRKDELTLSEVLTSIGTVTEPLLEMSCLQSLNDLLESVGGAAASDTAPLVAVLASAATSYVTQGVPTLFGQIERISEEQRMTTYTSKDAFLTTDMQYMLGKVSQKMPWDFQQIPYIDAWGRAEDTGNVVTKAFNNFLNPAYTSEIDTTQMELELLRLYEQTGDDSVFPSRADKYFTVGGQRKDLTAEEYVQYATLKGRYAYELLTDLLASSRYRTLSEAEKVEAIEDAYDMANQQAKAKVSSYKADGWMKNAQEAEKLYRIPVETYITLRRQTLDVEGLKDKNGEPIQNSKGLQIMQIVYDTPGLTEKQRNALFEYLGVGEKIRHWNKTRVNDELAKMQKKAG